MEVETYEVTEATSAGIECDAEAVKLIEKLGLSGQMDLITAPEGAKVRCPYRKMTREEEQVYKILMPKVSELKDYADGPIPLRVLQVAAHAAGMFDRLLVWCPLTGPKDDPILIGGNYGKNFNAVGYESERFLLARWGDCLLPFEKLVDRAAKIAKARVIDRLNKMRSDINSALEGLDTTSNERLLKWAISEPSIFNLD